MFSRPTTEQILLDCCRELTDSVLPALTDETAQVRVVMMEAVLRSMAVRAAHEVAWMTAETAAIEAYAADVAAAMTDADGQLAGAAAALAAADGGLHLDDVVERYCRAGALLSAALAVVLTAATDARPADDAAELVARGEALLRDRCATEREVMGGWTPTGR